MAYRRVHRNDPTSVETIPSETPPSMSFSARMLGFLSLIWNLLTILWYWTERLFLIGVLMTMTIGLAWWLSQHPSLLRDWEASDARLPEITWSWDTVTVNHIRNYRWMSSTGSIPGYSAATYDLDEIERVDYVITPFSDSDGPAHTMLTFTFSGGQHIAISPEIRKERGELFSAFDGIMNQFELAYIVADETDVIQLRTDIRKNTVYMYPIKTDKKHIQALFRSMLIRADKLSKEPEFYNTLWNNCATSILMHANALRSDKLSAGSYTLLPSHSDLLLYDAGLIDTELSLPDARAYYRIDEIARSATGDLDFSARIRKSIR